MTLNEALAKRDRAREQRRECRKKVKRYDDRLFALLNAEYNWGYWDAVLTILKNCGIKELDTKAVCDGNTI